MEQHPIYLISSYNILADNNTKFVQIVLIDIVCIVIVIFNLYLRIYTTKKYEKINNDNITDADYSILVRGLPLGTQ